MGMKKQSKNNTEFSSGAHRDDRKGKLRMTLLPTDPLKRIMKRYLDGAEEYTENNWTKGMDYSVFYDSAQRHMIQWWEGDETEDHLAAAAWNIMSLMHIEKHQPGFDDRNKFPR